MSGRYNKPYVESSVFIAFIKGEQDQGPNRNQDAKVIFDTVIDHAKAERFKIITSALTIAEVFKNKKTPQLTEQQNDDLRPYFREDYIQIVEIDREVGDRANELCRTLQADQLKGFKALRPNDAIHIAAAEKAGCDVVLAWDGDFLSQAPRLSSVKLENPETLGPVTPIAKQEALALNSAVQTDSATSQPVPSAPAPVPEKSGAEQNEQKIVAPVPDAVKVPEPPPVPAAPAKPPTLPVKAPSVPMPPRPKST